MLSCALYSMLIVTYAHNYYLASLLSVSFVVARYAVSIKYRGSVDPSMCDVQSKAFLKRAHI